MTLIIMTPTKIQHIRNTTLKHDDTQHNNIITLNKDTA
jgi:hypothetical protein